jgi:hypothetical protein
MPFISSAGRNQDQELFTGVHIIPLIIWPDPLQVLHVDVNGGIVT